MMMMMVLVLSTLVLFTTLDINFMYACMRLMLLAHIKSVAISGVQDELSLRIGIMRWYCSDAICEFGCCILRTTWFVATKPSRGHAVACWMENCKIGDGPRKKWKCLFQCNC